MHHGDAAVRHPALAHHFEGLAEQKEAAGLGIGCSWPRR
jgi:hypothetical protein